VLNDAAGNKGFHAVRGVPLLDSGRHNDERVGVGEFFEADREVFVPTDVHSPEGVTTNFVDRFERGVLLQHANKG
jgi:hypothetical protein